MRAINRMLIMNPLSRSKKLPILALFAVMTSCMNDNEPGGPSYFQIDGGEHIAVSLYTTLGPLDGPVICQSDYLMFAFSSDIVNGERWSLVLAGPSSGIHAGTFDLRTGCTDAIQYVELRKTMRESYPCTVGDGFWAPPVETTCTLDVNVSEFYFQADDFKHDVPGTGALHINKVDNNQVDLSFDFTLAGKHIAGRYSGAIDRRSTSLNIPWRAMPKVVSAYDSCFYFYYSLHPEPLIRQTLDLKVDGDNSNVTAIIELSGARSGACYIDELSFVSIELTLADRDSPEVIRYALLKDPRVVDFKAEPGNRLVFSKELSNLQLNHRYALSMRTSHHIISYDGKLFPTDAAIISYFTFRDTPFSCINENEELVVTCN